MLTNLGLGIIVIAWVFQLFTSIKEGSVLSPIFIIIYSIGVIFLIIDGFSSGLSTLAYFNLASLTTALMVLLATLVKKNY